MSLDSIPLLPDSIAVGIQEDLLQYLIEMKYLLLFFDKPLMILSSTGGNYINEEAIEGIRSNRKYKTSIWDDEQNFKNTDVIKTEDWLLIEKYSEVMHFDMNLEISDKPTEIEDKVEDVFYNPASENRRTIADIQNDLQKCKDTDEEWQKLLGEFWLRLEMQRLIDVIERCKNDMIPMVWGSTTDKLVVETYTNNLLERKLENVNDISAKTSLRVLLGKDLLKELFDISVVNLGVVPVDSIVTFKNRNRDLLSSFLTKYRQFLVHIQEEPEAANSLKQKYTQEIVSDIQTINNEVRLLNKAKNYRWLNRISEATFEGAKNGGYSAIWSFFTNPALFLGDVGKAIVNASLTAVRDLSTQDEKINALLFRSSSGYLWKAKEKFKS